MVRIILSLIFFIFNFNAIHLAFIDISFDKDTLHIDKSEEAIFATIRNESNKTVSFKFKSYEVVPVNFTSNTNLEASQAFTFIPDKCSIPPKSEVLITIIFDQSKEINQEKIYNLSFIQYEDIYDELTKKELTSSVNIFLIYNKYVYIKEKSYKPKLKMTIEKIFPDGKPTMDISIYNKGLGTYHYLKYPVKVKTSKGWFEFTFPEEDFIVFPKSTILYKVPWPEDFDEYATIKKGFIDSDL